MAVVVALVGVELGRSPATRASAGPDGWYALHERDQGLAVVHVGAGDAGGLKAYADSSPVTRASGKKSAITRRWVKNDRLNHAGYLWAFASLRASTGANSHYRRRREQGDWHAAAQRNLFNRMIGQLHHCLQKRELFDEQSVFPSPSLTAAAA